jgi:hypothetical protein
MNWISALGASQWLLLLAIPPAVLSLYFLKLKRRQMAVPSTLLWKRAIEDVHVNSIWQRLRKNLLLYLQLLLILACLRPGWNGQGRIGERRIYIIDNSASMQATDTDPTRLDVAKQKVRTLISGSSSDDVGMVIAFSDRADVRQGFTKEQSKLISSVESIQPTMHGTDVSEALRAAAGLANPGRSSFEGLTDIMVAEAVPATVYLFSDGGFGDLGDFDIGKLKIEYVPIGEPSASNVGIVNFAVQRSEDKQNQLEAYARIVNHSSIKAEFNASLQLDGQLLDASTVSIDPGQEAGLLFELSDLEQGQLKLELDYADNFAGDNVAYAAVRPARPINVLLVTPGNSALETAMQTAKITQVATLRIEGTSFLTDPKFISNYTDSTYDLIIFDQCSPAQMPLSNTLFIGSIPPANGLYANAVAKESSKSVETPPDGTKPDDIKPEAESKTAELSKSIGTTEWQFGVPQGPVIVLDVNRSNAMTQYLEMGSVGIVEARTIKPPESGDILMVGDIGPIFAVAPRGPFQDAVLGFSIVQAGEKGMNINTDWGIKRSFPVFVYSMVEYLGGGITESSAPSVQPGWPIGLQLSNRFKDFRVVSPNGESSAITRGDESRFLFTKTDVPGSYSVYAEGFERPVESFCVNLFSNRESDLSTEQSIKMGYEKVVASDTKIQTRQETWRWILLAGLGLLVLEWVIFNRRIFV